MRTFLETLYRVLFATFIGAMAFGQFDRFSVNDTSALYIHEIVLAMFIAVSCITGWKKISSMLHTRIIRLIGLFSVSIAISLGVALLTNPLTTVWIGALYGIRFLLYASLLPSVLIGFQLKWLRSQDVVTGVFVLFVMLALAGLFQYTFFPDMRFLNLLGWDDHYYRLVSTLFDPPFTAALLSIGFLMTLSKKEVRIREIALLVLFGSSLLLTYSRSGYLSLSAGLAILFFIRPVWRKKILIAFCVLGIGVFLLPRPASEGARLERVKSIEARSTSMLTSVQSFRWSTFLVGNGWYLSQSSRQPREGVAASHSSAPDNSYLHVLQSLGIPGLFVWLFLISTIIRRAIKHPEFIASYIALGVGGLFNNLLFYPWIMAVVWLMVAVQEDRA